MGTLKNKQTETHNGQILRHMVDRGNITPKEASDLYGCMRLSARIYDLRGMGIEIEMTRQRFVNRNEHHGTYAVYRVAGTIPESAKHLLK